MCIVAKEALVDQKKNLADFLNKAKTKVSITMVIVAICKLMVCNFAWKSIWSKKHT